MLHKVYRVENGQGFGMYNLTARQGCFTHIEPNYYDRRHPTPYSDALLSEVWSNMPYEDRSQYYFGFCSLEQLKSWIYRSRWRQGLTERGFKVSVYEVPDPFFHPGDTQAVFKKDEARHIETLSLLDI